MRFNAGFFFGATDRVAIFRFEVGGGDFFAPTRGTAFAERRLPPASFLETLSTLGFLATGSPLSSMSQSSGATISRFAPTPNGRLHLGHAYSALRNARFARDSGGELLLRIEDVDRARCKREFEEAMYEDLAWLGIGFARAPRRQSEHSGDYAEALSQLVRRELVYPCFCTRGEILRTGGERDPDGAPLHRGGCIAVSASETAARLTAGEPAALRLNIARARSLAPGRLYWCEFGEDEAEQRFEAEPEAWGDIVLRGKDRPAAYHLAVVVDDALQGVTDVIRGRDLFPSTSVHRLLQELLGYEPPRYRHHRLVLDAAGAKMSKSASSQPLSCLRESGLTADELRGALGFDGSGAQRLRVVLS
jgi:glutamyl-Q tRNA(Asp) synthetase